MKYILLSLITTLFINLLCLISLNWSGYWALRPINQSNHFYNSFIETHPNRDLKQMRNVINCLKLPLSQNIQKITVMPDDKKAVMWLSRGGIYALPRVAIDFKRTVSAANDQTFNLTEGLRRCSQ